MANKPADRSERHFKGARLRDIILGTQDGLVNVLGLILGVASATGNALIVIVAGLAATFAETISMAAVAYTSTKAERDSYLAELEKEKKEVEEIPGVEKQEIRDIYYKKGLRGRLLEAIVNKITSNKKVWVETMMLEELQIPPKTNLNPKSSFVTVFISTLIGSLIPLSPFLFLGIEPAIISTLFVSAFALFALGVTKAKFTIGSWVKSGFESVAIGMLAALVGYAIGYYVGMVTGIRTF